MRFGTFTCTPVLLMPSLMSLSALKHTFLQNLVKNLRSKFEIPSMADWQLAVLLFQASMGKAVKVTLTF